MAFLTLAVSALSMALFSKTRFHFIAFAREFIIIVATRFLFLLEAVEFKQLEAGKAVSWLGERLLHEANSLSEFFIQFNGCANILMRVHF